MKKVLLLFGLLCMIVFASAQAPAFDPLMPETYVSVTVNKSQLYELSRHFSVDAVTRHADGTCDVRLCVGRLEYDAFQATGIPFTVVSAPKAQVNMASSYVVSYLVPTSNHNLEVNSNGSIRLYLI